MLVLTRRKGENILLDFSGMSDVELMSLRESGPIKVAVVEVRRDKVQLGFDAPASVKVHRQEIFNLNHP